MWRLGRGRWREFLFLLRGRASTLGPGSYAERVSDLCCVQPTEHTFAVGGQGPAAAEPWLSGCQVLSGDLSGCRALYQALSGASVRPAVRCCQCCPVLSGACLTSEVLCSCRVLSELSGVAVRRCQSCQSCQAAAAVT